jgi:anhydro-N-acetylmuramic acid kinase
MWRSSRPTASRSATRAQAFIAPIRDPNAHGPDWRRTGVARRLRIPVAYDFRPADMTAGGQGTLLVPLYHQALAATFDWPRPIAVLDIGGVANVTCVDQNDDLVAFDTGPATPSWTISCTAYRQAAA